MRTIFLFLLILTIVKPASSQDAKDFMNPNFLKNLNNDISYSELRSKIVSEFAHKPSGHWGEFVTGVYEKILTQKKIIAFTFDACGGKNGNKYDKEMKRFLQPCLLPENGLIHIFLFFLIFHEIRCLRLKTTVLTTNLVQQMAKVCMVLRALQI